ncbi:hypothetical protein HTSR_1964 [Halodesulfurarchaeum formicicum]|uniref:Uncharacterized protein n=1 Tax=Halodesulfurarchaeum formicicum TaxID=1873524 RepID=A0A1D8S6Z3_9EURY|nr:hypothetical protein HTSR_1964 [Halodesulfurarchaeum formicicum]
MRSNSMAAAHTPQGRQVMTDVRREGYSCPDGWFEVRDDAGPHCWIACRDPVTVER